MEQKYYTDERNVQIVISLLKAHGIRKIVASPGTTNITFVGSVQQDPYFEIYSSVDERSAAYIACGLAAESGETVVLTCTGATASRNYYSGLTEAYYRKLPVLALTSHQGNYRIGQLIAQNIDRRQLPNDIVTLSVEAPLVRDDNDEQLCTINVNNALLALTRHGGGPVHINLFTTYSRNFSVKELPVVRCIRRYTPNDKMPQLPEGKIAVTVGSHLRFTEGQTQAIDDFCATHDAVVFCDNTSGYYGRYKVVFSLVATQHQYESSNRKVNLLIHIGEVSGDYSGMGVRSNEVWRVNLDGELRDPMRRLTKVFEMPEADFFRHYAKEGQSRHAYLDACREEDAVVRSRIPELPFGNIWAAQHTMHRLPVCSVLHLGILNTLRSWNFFPMPEGVEGYSNVGGFGIDGDVSSLIGSSLAHPEKLYFGVFGDLAFFYDMNVVGNRHVGNNIRIMLVNNGKGGEFRNYGHPCSAFGKDAEPYMAAAGHYGNKSADLVRHYAEDLGYEYLAASTKEEYLTAVERWLHPSVTNRPILFEVFVDSAEEYKALELISNFMVDAKTVLKRKMKGIVKDVFGEGAVQTIKNILGE
ncbi:thiamine pyrophosphate-binding protein [Bacteroides sp. AN502(2024)]|uniref:thiamine pyrophosphate-binding protein n=1 Tax=Bacteroides sp. AN502(2024) TaxID=3160599 RepID=UPI00351811AF